VSVGRRILQAVGRGSGGFLIGLFLIGYAAPYLPPTWFWWTDLLALMLPLLGAGVGVLAVALIGQGVYKRTWGRVGLAVTLLVFVAVRFGPSAVVSGASGKDARMLGILTFNVPPSQARDSASAARLRRLMQREAPEVLALQETWVRISSRRGIAGASETLRGLLVDSLGYAVPRAHPLQTTIHQPVVGRIGLDSVSVHPLPPDGDTNPRSRYTRTVFDWEGREAVLYNVHLHTVGTHPRDLRAAGWALGAWRALFRTYRESALRRAKQARVLRRHIERETRSVLVVGDFNSTPHQWAYRHVAEGLQRTGGWGCGATFPAQWPVVQIDHVLAGPAWTIVGAQVPTVDKAASISDHRPVAARVQWRDD